MHIVQVWTTSDSYIEYLIDDDGNIVGVGYGGNRGPAFDSLEVSGHRSVRVEKDTLLADLTDALAKEMRRLAASLSV
jgi:hypothetical protein